MLQADLAYRVRLKLIVTYFSDIQPREVIMILVILFVEKIGGDIFKADKAD